MQSEIHIQDLACLKRFSEKLATCLAPGDCLALNGSLGAGKTALVQALAEAFGVSETVASPTFVLIHEYLSGRSPLIHIDLYRLGPEKSQTLMEEVLTMLAPVPGKAPPILLVEWAEYGDFLNPLITMTLHIRALENESRLITLTTPKRAVHEILGNG